MVANKSSPALTRVLPSSVTKEIDLPTRLPPKRSLSAIALNPDTLIKPSPASRTI